MLTKSERLSRYCFFLAAVCLTGVGSADSARGFIDETRIGVLEPVDGPSGAQIRCPRYQSRGAVRTLRSRIPEQRFEPPSATAARHRHVDQYQGGYQRGLRRAYLGCVSHQAAFPGGLGRGSASHRRRPRLRLYRQFRESGSVGVMLSERWDMLATMAHMSNANLCDENRGLTDVGIRFGRKW